jgi:hypothetical protein
MICSVRRRWCAVCGRDRTERYDGACTHIAYARVEDANKKPPLAETVFCCALACLFDCLEQSRRGFHPFPLEKDGLNIGLLAANGLAHGVGPAVAFFATVFDGDGFHR